MKDKILNTMQGLPEVISSLFCNATHELPFISPDVKKIGIRFTVKQLPAKMKNKGR
jgi:hypothetical protein